MGNEKANRKYYLRFGEIPKCGRSGIWSSLTDPWSLIGREDGVSCWRAVLMDGLWSPVYPPRPTATTFSSFETFFSERYRDLGRRILLITGELVGYGSDGECLLSGARVVRELAPSEIMDFHVPDESKLALALRVQSCGRNDPEKDASLLNVREWAESNGLLPRRGDGKRKEERKHRKGD